jgi:Tol biopolymer transport system component
MPFSISADGKLLIGHVNSIVRRGNDFWALSLTDGKTGGAKPKSFLDSRSVKNDAQVSPDGHWVAYQSNESGKNEIYVVPYPAADQKFPISTDGGTNPRWSRSGRELFYRSGNLGTKMMAVDLQTTPALRASPPRMLFEGAYALTSYDVSPDGQRFLMVKPPAVQPAPSDQLIVVVNWLDELRGRVPLGK